MFKLAYIFLVLFLSCSIDLSAAKTKGLSRIKRISSSSLGYDLRYKVYVPPEYEQLSDLPVIYVTDGPGYINHGKMPKIMTRLIKNNKIKPVIAVFIDPRDPHNISINRRR